MNGSKRIERLSLRDSELLDSMFGDSDNTDEDFSLDMPEEPDVDGFSGVKSPGSTSMRSGDVPPERVGNAFMETKMVPMTIMTDGNTATQVVMLLEMIRYCMENSKEIIDSTNGEAKEYDIHLKIRNRGKSNFLVSIGDESMSPIPVSEKPWFIGS